MRIPLKHIFKGRGKEILLWPFKQNECDMKLNFVLNWSALHYIGEQTVYPLAWSFGIVLFLKVMFVQGHFSRKFLKSCFI